MGNDETYKRLTPTELAGSTDLRKPTTSLTVTGILRLESLPRRLVLTQLTTITQKKKIPLKTITTWRSVFEANYVEIGYNASQRSTTFVSPN